MIRITLILSIIVLYFFDLHFQQAVKFEARRAFDVFLHIRCTLGIHIKREITRSKRYLNMAIWSVRPPLRVSGLPVSYPRNKIIVGIQIVAHY